MGERIDCVEEVTDWVVFVEGHDVGDWIWVKDDWGDNTCEWGDVTCEPGDNGELTWDRGAGSGCSRCESSVVEVLLIDGKLSASNDTNFGVT